MATDQLTASTGDGSLTNTGTPQNSAAANGLAGGTPSSIQPGTNNNLLTNTGGIPLTVGPLTTVNVGTKSAQIVASQPVKAHQIHPALFVVSFVLLAVAVFLFYATTRADKSTTTRR